MHPFINDFTITDLGFASGFALWGFRAIAAGNSRSCCLSAGFNKAFAIDCLEARSQHGGTHGRLAMNALKSFSYQLGNTGRRTISLAESGTMRVTADEICVVGALTAAQNGNDALCHAHLSWLLGSTETRLAHIAAVTYSQICTSRGMHMQYPEIEISVPMPPQPTPQFSQASHFKPPQQEAISLSI